MGVVQIKGLLSSSGSLTGGAGSRPRPRSGSHEVCKDLVGDSDVYGSGDMTPGAGDPRGS